MTQILRGAGGSSQQFCTVTLKQIHDVNIFNYGFPINGFISDTKVLFKELNEEQFLSLTTEQRFILTHIPLSDINIVPSSLLQAYLRCFSWLIHLIGHLNAGVRKWSPSSVKDKVPKVFFVDN